MRFKNFYSENEYAEDAEFVVEVHLPNGCGYSHLGGSLVKQPDERFDAAKFDALLSDYDRILLRFGMRISW